MSIHNEDDYLKIHYKIMEYLSKIRIPGEARQVLDAIILLSGYSPTYEASVSLPDIASITGLKKVTISKAIKKLCDMNLITKLGNVITKLGNNNTVSYCFNDRYLTWKPLPKKVMPITKKGNDITKKGNDMTQKGNDEKSLCHDLVVKNQCHEMSLHGLPMSLHGSSMSLHAEEEKENKKEERKESTKEKKEDRTKEKEFKNSFVSTFETKVYELNKLLFDLIKNRRPNFRIPTEHISCREIDKMIRIDKRDPNEIEKIIRWCQADEFWQNNILSTSKLRKQYDQLALKMHYKKPMTAREKAKEKADEITRKFLAGEDING